MIVKTTPTDLARHMRKLPPDLQKVIRRGVELGAMRGVAILRKKTPVDTGGLRASWEVDRGRASNANSVSSRALARIVNDSPIVGIIEKGARPHPVSRAGIDAITMWVWRHASTMGVPSLEEARQVAYRIANKIRTRGQKPTYFIRLCLPQLGAAMLNELVYALERYGKDGK